MRRLSFFLFLFGFVFFACGDDDNSVTPDDESMPGDLSDIPYDPVAYDLVVPQGYPTMEIPSDNPLTVDGVELGRHLFYDPILSADNTQSCSSCHEPSGSFTDNLAVSVGIDGIAGRRSSMSLLNIGYVYVGLFWDGRSTTLEEQALLPVEDPIEMHNQWPNVIEEFKEHDNYPAMFRRAFGIDSRSEITKELAAKAIAQFERTLVSSGQSKYDRALNEPGVFFTEEELRGLELFTFEENEHPGCTHCHKTFNRLFTDHRFLNNGIEDLGGCEIEDLNNFPDLGLGEVTGNIFDNGKFRTPTLLNIAHTGPYMHDGRFETLEEVLDHYSSGGFCGANLDPNIQQFPLSELERSDIIAFLHTLTDTVFMNNPAHHSPF